MARKIKNNSILRFGNLVEVDGIEFWDLIIPTELPTQPDDVTHEVSGFDRLDSIARTYYGDPTLYWIIAIRNEIELIPTDLNVGTVLNIPSPRYVRQIYFAKVKK